MSLRDTITGATKEAREATASLSKKETSEETERPSYSAFGRKSAATAKPVREAAASVRVSGSGSGSSAPKSKEEKRAARARQREREDIRSRGFEAMLRADPDYHRAERVWWVFLGLGFVGAFVYGSRVQGSEHRRWYDFCHYAGLCLLLHLWIGCLQLL